MTLMFSTPKSESESISAMQTSFQDYWFASENGLRLVDVDGFIQRGMQPRWVIALI